MPVLKDLEMTFVTLAGLELRLLGHPSLGTSLHHVWFVGSEVFTAVTMKNVVFWDIKTQFVPHRRHITSPLQSPAS
jgi:hypothetical protein